MRKSAKFTRPGLDNHRKAPPHELGRARLRKRTHGRAYLFNPERLGDKPSNLRWNPIEGCRDRETAINRAGYLLSGTAAGGGGSTSDREFWTNQANKVLRAYLVAAAYSGASLMKVKEWANKPSDRTAVELLMSLGEADLMTWADELKQILDSYDRLRESVFVTLAQVFDCLGSPGAREIIEVEPGQHGFDAEEFLSSRGTLYCIGAHKDYASVAPLFCALTGMIYDTAKQMAQRSRTGRLDPPVLFALDEAPNVVPLPLHRLTSEGRGLGITFVICIQALQQLDDVWNPTRGSIILSNCKAKVAQLHQ